MANQLAVQMGQTIRYAVTSTARTVRLCVIIVVVVIVYYVFTRR